MRWKRILGGPALPLLGGAFHVPGILDVLDFWQKVLGDMSAAVQGALMGAGSVLFVVWLGFVVEQNWARVSLYAPGRKLKRLYDHILAELDRIEEEQGSATARTIKRQVLTKELQRLKIPCPPSRHEVIWRIFLMRLLVCSSNSDVKGARSLIDDLEKFMRKQAIARRDAGLE